jgi:glycoprotein 3-alpha-L-fucosyltransferase
VCDQCIDHLLLQFSIHRYWEEYFYPRWTNHSCQAWCKITFDRGDVGKADLILFSDQAEDQVPPPLVRHPWQLWGFFAQDPPFLSPRNKTELDKWVFNWTLTYRLDSDVAIPHGEFKTKKKLGKKDVSREQHQKVLNTPCL